MSAAEKRGLVYGVLAGVVIYLIMAAVFGSECRRCCRAAAHQAQERAMLLHE